MNTTRATQTGINVLLQMSIGLTPAILAITMTPPATGEIVLPSPAATCATAPN
nr:MAG TPA: hypothetical protein [Caudoviricetes sp.]